MPPAAIPITIITGFLGSGKTTLILNLMPQLRARQPDYKLALLKNEFGDLAVDSQLASASAVSGVREMLNGCICCNLVGHLGDALSQLEVEVDPDRIVVETSGSAFPATLALEVNRLAKKSGGRYALDGVVSVVDVENWQGYEDTSYTAKVQARYTDLVVFNKWESCSEDRFDEVLDRLGDLDVETPWVRSRRGWVGVDLVFGVDGALAKGLTEEDGGKGSHGHDHKHGRDHDHDHDDGDHARDHQTEVEVLSVQLRSSAANAAVRAQNLLTLLKAAPKEQVYRIKSVLTIAGPAPDSDRVDDGGNANPTPPDEPDGDAAKQAPSRYILNWAFGRWTFTPVSGTTAEHESSDNIPVRMTLICARYESNKWKRKLQGGDYLTLAGGDAGEMVVEKIL